MGKVNNKARRRIGSVVKQLLLIFMTLIMFFPLYIVFIMGTYYSEDIFKAMPILPSSYLLNNLRMVISKGYFQAYLNSIIVSVCSVAISVLISTMIGFALAKYNFKGKKIIFGFVMAIMMIPGQISLIGYMLEMRTLRLSSTLDVYKRQDTGWESIWCHFDGQMVRAYYDLTVSYLGNIFTLVDDYPVLNKMTAIYQTFAEGRPIREALLSKQLTDIWTALLMDQAERPGSRKVGRVSVWDGDSIGMENVISYINEHFNGKITIQTLAEQAMLSQRLNRNFSGKMLINIRNYIFHSNGRCV